MLMSVKFAFQKEHSIFKIKRGPGGRWNDIGTYR